MTLSTKLRASVNATQTSPRDLGTASDPVATAWAVTLDDGTGAGQANRIFSDTRTLAASANEDLDLAGSGLTDAFGATLTFAKVKAIYISAAAGNTNNVIVGGATSNGFVSWVGGATHTVTIKPGGAFALFAGEADVNGYAVTAGTGDLLRIANSGGTTGVTYTIVIVGTAS